MIHITTESVRLLLEFYVRFSSQFEAKCWHIALNRPPLHPPTFFRFMIDNHPVLPGIKVLVPKLSRLSPVSPRYFNGARDEDLIALSRHFKNSASAIEASPPQPVFTY
jgi:hypothetical protein